MGRVESFSDGVIAVIITIMVLEIHPPETASIAAFRAGLPSLLLYALSFIVVASMWVHHHGLLHSARRTNARFLWSNLNLLFWMSLIPYATSMLGRFPHDSLPIAAYGSIFLITSLSFWILQTVIANHNPEGTPEKETLTSARTKSLSAVLAYIIAIVSAWYYQPLSYAIFLFIALSYLLPPLFAIQHSEP